jgi:aminoglycoside phosphotransferase family enzyme/predicted kinase
VSESHASTPASTGPTPDFAGQRALLASLLDPAAYPHPVDAVRIVETHISWVLLAGAYAYKIKKAVRLGFLDFSSATERKRFCAEEIRLNRRLAADIYLDVVAIVATPDGPRIGGAGPAVEHAVRMRRFAENDTLDRMIDQGRADAGIVDALAGRIARFHREAPRMQGTHPWGTPESILGAALDNVTALAALPVAAQLREPLGMLTTWTRKTAARLDTAFVARREAGFIRECHGDLHPGNVAVIGGAPVPFDCIEFNESFRWIDVMSEIAFPVMDLDCHGRPDWSWRLLNGYLEVTGDFDGLCVLRFYVVYRALVRAKVRALAAGSGRTGPEEDRHLRSALAHVDTARRWSAPAAPFMVLMHGLSGSGKSTLARRIAEELGAVVIRSDVERKRLHGLEPQEASGSGCDAGIYGPTETAATYARLEGLAATILRSGFSVVVDAAFLRLLERRAFAALGRKARVPFAIAACAGSVAQFAARIRRRAAAGTDASEATVDVLHRQTGFIEPIGGDEADRTFRFDGIDDGAMLARIAACLRS